jgi:hypothetical protein
LVEGAGQFLSEKMQRGNYSGFVGLFFDVAQPIKWRLLLKQLGRALLGGAQPSSMTTQPSNDGDQPSGMVARMGAWATFLVQLLMGHHRQRLTGEASSSCHNRRACLIQCRVYVPFSDSHAGAAALGDRTQMMCSCEKADESRAKSTETEVSRTTKQTNKQTNKQSEKTDASRAPPTRLPTNAITPSPRPSTAHLRPICMTWSD